MADHAADMRARLAAVVLAAGALTAGCRLAAPTHGCSLDAPTDATVTRVVDGDTFHAKTCAGDVTVRVIGLDTPETKKPRTPVQCYGPEATVYAKTALGGRAVRLIPDRKAGLKDKYGRRLYRVEIDGADYALDAIQAGAGRHNDYGHRQARSAQYASAQQSAQNRRVGLWGVC